MKSERLTLHKRKGKNFGVFLLMVMLLSTAAHAPARFDADAIQGIWWNQEKSGRIEVFKRNSRYFGKIIWLDEPFEADGKTLKTDQENPEEALKTRQIIGLEILQNLRFDGDEWDDGQVYDPESGNTYSCYCTFENPDDLNTLKLRGYVLGMPFLGRTSYWTKFFP